MGHPEAERVEFIRFRSRKQTERGIADKNDILVEGDTLRRREWSPLDSAVGSKQNVVLRTRMISLWKGTP